MSASANPANLACGENYKFGRQDEVVFAGSLEGAIKSLTVKGLLIGSADAAGEYFGVVAHKGIGSVVIVGKAYKPPFPDVFGNVAIQDNIAVSG